MKSTTPAGTLLVLALVLQACAAKGGASDAEMSQGRAAGLVGQQARADAQTSLANRPDAALAPAGGTTGCVIDGKRHAQGEDDPSNPCQWCEGGSRRNAWTPKPDGTPCDDGLACTQSDACHGGKCWGGNPRGCPDPWAGYVPDPTVYNLDSDPARLVTAGGSTFAVNELLVTVVPGTSRADLESLATPLGGTVVGQIPDFRFYKLRFGTRTVEELEKKRLTLQADPRVRLVGRNLVTVGKSEQSTPRVGVKPVGPGAKHPHAPKH